MSETVVNLRRVRKAKARADADIKAAENRARFGTPKADRALADANKALERRVFDGHRRATDTEPERE